MRVFVGDADHDGLPREGREGAVEVAATVAEPVARVVEADERHDDGVRRDFAAPDRVRNPEHAGLQPDSGVPLTEHERCFRRHDHRQRGHRTLLAQGAGEETGVVLALVRPAEGENTACEARKPAPEVAVDRFAKARQRFRVERVTFFDQLGPQRLSPGFDFVGRHTTLQFWWISRGAVVFCMCFIGLGEQDRQDGTPSD